MPKISVIVPCFNQGRFLGQALDSILNQPVEDWECLIIDDGSNDNSQELAYKYVNQDPRFKYLYQKNQGVSTARNVGIMQAKGKYIHFLDADDLVLPNLYSEFVKILDSDDCIDLIYGKTNFIDVNGIFINKPYKLPKNIENYAIQLLLGNLFPIQAVLVRHQILITNNLFFEDTRPEDWALWLKMALLNCRFYQFEAVVCTYRKHSQARSTQILKKVLSAEKLLETNISEISKRQVKAPSNIENLAYSSMYIKMYFDALECNDVQGLKYCYNKIIEYFSIFKLWGKSKYHYFILGRYLDVVAQKKSLALVPLIPLVWLRKFKRLPHSTLFIDKC
jgi:glycosyltransferase involved in cell wall biosynthesis